MTELSEVFYLSVVTSAVAVVGLIVRYCLKSKCDDVEICGNCIKIHRDVRAEEEIELGTVRRHLDRTKNTQSYFSDLSKIPTEEKV